MGGCRRWQLNLIDFLSNTACRCGVGARSHTLWRQQLACSWLQGALKSAGLILGSKGKEECMASPSDSTEALLHRSEMFSHRFRSRIKLHLNTTTTCPQSFLLPWCSAAASACLPAVVVPLTSTENVTAAARAEYAWWTNHTSKPAAARKPDSEH